MSAVGVGHPELVREVAARLAVAGVPTPQVDAQRIVDHVVEVAGDPIGDGAALLADLVDRRAAREPLQLVLGRTWFRHLELACTPGVFVPRPETEVVAGHAIEAARPVARPIVVEPCCGGGAIALSVATELPGARVVAGDVDTAAVALARHNLERVVAGEAGVPGLAAGSSAEVVHSELLAGFDDRLAGQVDVLVANPPYLPAAERGSWQPEVARHDPDRALVGGEDGHEVVRALLTAAAEWLAPGGSVVVEIDERRASDATTDAVRAGLCEARVVPDLSGVPRAVIARRGR